MNRATVTWNRATVTCCLALAAAAALAAPAAAQHLDGVWYARLLQPNGLAQFELTLNRGQYALTSSLTTAEGYNYLTYQAGAAEFYPPDRLRLVVFDWQPREYLGRTMAMPPNSNLTILRVDGRSLTLMDNVCAMSAPAASCTTTYQRVQ
jgi:hypothetical protein